MFNITSKISKAASLKAAAKKLVEQAAEYHVQFVETQDALFLDLERMAKVAASECMQERKELLMFWR